MLLLFQSRAAERKEQRINLLGGVAVQHCVMGCIENLSCPGVENH